MRGEKQRARRGRQVLRGTALCGAARLRRSSCARMRCARRGACGAAWRARVMRTLRAVFSRAMLIFSFFFCTAILRCLP